MLQQFTIENFLSFKDKEILLLQPNKGSLKKDHKMEPTKGQWVLKSDDLIDFYPFRLSSENKKKDTTIIYHILCGNKKYEYGFSYNAEQISLEWLKQINKNNECVIFQRNTKKSNFDISYLLKLNPKEEESQFLQKRHHKDNCFFMRS